MFYCEWQSMESDHLDREDPSPGKRSADPRQTVAAAIRRWGRVLTFLLMLAVIAGQFGAQHLYLDQFSHFQLQYVACSLILLTVLVGLRSFKWAALASSLLIWTSWLVIPWYLPRHAPPQSDTNLRLMLVNVLQSNTHYEDVVSQIEQVDPDVVVLQEINQIWLDNLQPLSDGRPFSIHVPGGVLRGMAIFSRFPLDDLRSEEFGDRMTPSVIATLTVNETSVSLLATHPWPPSCEFDYRARNKQLEQVGQFMANQPDPRILIGDLNLSMWSPHYEKLISTAGLKNVRRGFGVLPSFPMDSLRLIRVPIDHCLVSRDIAVADCRLGEVMGSDHASLIVDLVIPVAK